MCWRSTEAGSMLHDLHMSLEEVTRSVKALIDMYCRTFHTEFRFESTSIQRGSLLIHIFVFELFSQFPNYLSCGFGKKLVI